MTAGTISFVRGEDPLRADKLNSGLNERLLATGDSMKGPLFLSRDPASGLEAATKNYVDTHMGSVTGEAPVDGAGYGRLNNTWARVLLYSGDIVDGGNF